MRRGTERVGTLLIGLAPRHFPAAIACSKTECEMARSLFSEAGLAPASSVSRRPESKIAGVTSETRLAPMACLMRCFSTRERSLSALRFGQRSLSHQSQSSPSVIVDLAGSACRPKRPRSDSTSSSCARASHSFRVFAVVAFRCCLPKASFHFAYQVPDLLIADAMRSPGLLQPRRAHGEQLAVSQRLDFLRIEAQQAAYSHAGNPQLCLLVHPVS